MKGMSRRAVIGTGAVILGATAAAAIIIGPVAAQVKEDEVRLPFSALGIAPGQTAVLNVALLAVPPNPCRATLTFYDASGQVLGTREEPATTQVILEEPNIAESFELPAVQASGEGRTLILPAVQVPPSPCADLVATVEVVDPGGRTTVLVNPGTLRGLNPQPEPPS